MIIRILMGFSGPGNISNDTLIANAKIASQRPRPLLIPLSHRDEWFPVVHANDVEAYAQVRSWGIDSIQNPVITGGICRAQGNFF